MTTLKKMNNIATKETLVASINHARDSGYKLEFTYTNGKLVSGGYMYTPSEIHIDEMQRFEGMSNPADNMILYLVSTEDGRKGYFSSAYGIKANSKAMELFTEAEETEAWRV